MMTIIYGRSPERISLIYELLAEEELSPRVAESVDQTLGLLDRDGPSVVVLADVDEAVISILPEIRDRPGGEFTTIAAAVDSGNMDRLSTPARQLIDMFLVGPFERSDGFRAQVAAVRKHAERSRAYYRTDKRCSELQDRYRLLFQESMDAVLILDAEREILEANPASVDMFGYGPEELSLEDLYVDPRAGDRFWRRLEREGKVVGYELELQHRDDHHLHCILSGIVREETYQVIIRDCTAERNLRERVLDTEKRFRAIFNSTFQFIGLLDVDGILLEANKPALEFAGVDRDDVVGEPFWETPWWAHSEPARTRLRHGIDRAVRGHTVRFETEHLSGEGEEMVVDFSLTPVPDETGEVAFLVAEGRDVTERRRVERELMSLREEERRQIGHDLQEWLGQMLTGITMISESLKQDLLRENSDLARKAEDILRFVQEADEFTYHLSRGVIPVELDAEGLTTALERLAEQSQSRYDIECTFEEEGNVRVPDNTISTSLYWLTQEAIENAVSEGKASRVHITVMQTDRHIRVTVRDNGIVPAENLDVFMREDRDLRLMQYRARLIGGFLDLTVPPSGGRLFTCTVPLEDAG